MGKTVTPKYRIELRDQNGWHMEAWAGRVSSKDRLDQWRVARNLSYTPGGVNHRPTGPLPHIDKVRIVNQKTGQVMQEVSAPMFEIV